MFRIFLLFFLLFSLNALAEVYFPADTISPILLTKPLSRNSIEYKNEVKQIVEIQHDHVDKSEIIKEAKREQILKLDTIVLAVSSKLKRTEFPNLYKMFDNVFDTVKPVTENAKTYWNTKRPYLSEKKIKLLVNPILNPSYPSGHTCLVYVVAKILGKAMPEKAAIFEDRAEKISWHRVIVGVHYPNDIVGGKELSYLVLGSLMQNENFLHDFDLAKKELAEKY